MDFFIKKYTVKIKIIFLLFLFSVTLFAQTQVRIASYNLHDYPNQQDANFKKVIAAINPDALIVVEMMSQDGINNFLTNSLTPDYTADYASSIGYNNDCALYYKSSVFSLIAKKSVYATTRNLSEFTLVHKITNDTLVIFGVHLKANTYTDNDPNLVKRSQEAVSLKNETKTFKANTNYLVCGDFNILSSTESAFQTMIDKSTPGYFIDMLNVTGDWNGNSQYSPVCTWSTRAGITVRFDMVLVSQAIMDKGGIDYIPNSFKIFGNDGNRWNQTVTGGTNSWFPSDASIGTALYNASDHYPVYVDLAVGVAPTAVEAFNELPKQYELKQNYPNPFNPSTTIQYTIPAEPLHATSLQHVTLKVYDMLGREIATLVNEEKSAGTYHVKFDAGKLTSGIYLYSLQSGSHLFMKKMIYLK